MVDADYHLYAPSLFNYGFMRNGMANWLMTGNCWKTAFAFELIGVIFFLWMIIMSWRVHRDVA